ncbi:MAG: hypothetical protein Q9165_008497 [Trypethelium subeluteriae]
MLENATAIQCRLCNLQARGSHEDSYDAFVVVGDIDGDAAKALATQFGESNAIGMRCDVREWSDQLSLFETAISVAPRKRVDIVIANAGLGGANDPMMLNQGTLWNSMSIVIAVSLLIGKTDPEETPQEPDLNIIDVNIRGVFYTTRLATHYLKRFKRQDEETDRCLILKGSMAGYIDWPRSHQYPASKSAIRHLMKCMRHTSRDDGIRVNVVAPAFVDTGVIPAAFKTKLTAAGMEFAEVEDAVSAVLRIACDPTIHGMLFQITLKNKSADSTTGRSLGILPRTRAPEGYIDLAVDDLKPADSLYAFEHMALNMNTAIVELKRFMAQQGALDIAIVGGGIVGLICAIGLVERGIRVRVYEQADSIREDGAGLAFTKNAVQCMKLVSPLAAEALRSTQTPNGDPDHPNDHLQWVDGFNQPKPDDPSFEPMLFRLFVGANGFEGCHRAHLLEALWKRLPSDVVVFGRKLQTLQDDLDSEKLQIHFVDGSVEEADAVIGCDGIKSRTRQILLGPDSPASYPQYTHKLSYRALVPMDKVIPALGANKALNQCIHIGPQRHLLHFPVANQTLLNVVAFNTDDNPWTREDGRLTATATREEVVDTFKDWNDPVRTITQMFPETSEKWAVFDSFHHPVPFYTRHRVCLAGDAAHAAAPHHGAGAGVGVEDVLCLATALTKASTLANDAKAAAAAAFTVYNDVRYERTQWLVRSSHEVCDMYELDHPLTRGDMAKCREEIEARSHKIWYFDYQAMLDQTLRAVEAKLESARPQATDHGTRGVLEAIA